MIIARHAGSSCNHLRQSLVIMGRAQWLQHKLVPRMIESGSFGSKDVVVHSCEVEEKSAGVDHFASCAYFVEVVLKRSDGGPLEPHYLLVKMQPDLEQVRQRFLTDVMFLNEGNIYSQVVPGMTRFLKSLPQVPENLQNLLQGLFPRSYYVSTSRDPDNDVVVIENLKPQGYSMSPDKLILDYDHCLLALDNLGKYHAISYGMKQLDPEQFFRLTRKLEEVVFNDREDTFESDDFLAATGRRGLSYLEEHQLLDDDVIRRFKDKLQSPYCKMQRYLAPEEPLAVISHGDFCRNNMLFKYDGGGNRSRPKDVKFFDFQTSRYTSPAIDLSFFLFMNTSPEMRAEHWDHLVDVYLDSLHKTLCTILGCEQVPQQFSADNLKHDLKSRAFYAYFLCSFFIPCMMTDRIDMTIHMTHEEQKQQYVAMAGEPATVRLAELVKEFIHREFV